MYSDVEVSYVGMTGFIQKNVIWFEISAIMEGMCGISSVWADDDSIIRNSPVNNVTIVEEGKCTGQLGDVKSYCFF